MNILMTGASGFVSKELLPLLAREHRVFAVSRNQLTSERPVEWVCADLADPSFTQVLPKKIDVVVALAQSRHYRQFPDKANDIYAINIQALFHLLEWARQTQVSRVLFTSSANVYAYSNERISESSLLQPTTFYAQSKRAGEILVESYASFMESIVFRVFTVYGPEQKGTMIPQLVQRIITKQAVDITGKEGLRTSPIYVTDLCRALAAAIVAPLEKPGFSILNVGGDEIVSIREIAESLGRIIGVAPRFHFHPGPDLFGWAADNSQVKKRYSLGSFLTVEQGLRKTVHDLRSDAA